MLSQYLPISGSNHFYIFNTDLYHSLDEWYAFMLDISISSNPVSVYSPLLYHDIRDHTLTLFKVLVVFTPCYTHIRVAKASIRTCIFLPFQHMDMCLNYEPGSERLVPLRRPRLNVQMLHRFVEMMMTFWNRICWPVSGAPSLQFELTKRW